MTERDPFGRLPNDNPLEFLGKPANGTHTAAAAAEAEAAAASAAEQAAEPQTPRRSSRHAKLRRPSSSGRLDSSQITTIARRTIKSVVVLAVLVALGGGLAALLLVGDTTHGGSTAHSVAAAPDPRSTPTPPSKPARSLLTRRALAAALARLGTSGLGRLRSLSIRPQRIDAQLLTRGGRLRSVQLTAAGVPHTLVTSGAGFGALPTIPFARVDAAAPPRLARAAAKRLGQPLSHVDYVVLLAFGPALTWSAYMRDGKHLLADAHGRITRRAG